MSIIHRNNHTILAHYRSTSLNRTNLNRGKGTPRRKTKRVHKTSTTDDKKLQTTLKKMNVQPIQAIEEVNMFKEDGNVIHFSNPKGNPPSFPFDTVMI
jgi:hypothetical protein